MTNRGLQSDRMIYMEGAISQIKSKLDIVEFIGSYIPVKKTGRNFKAVCPFHKEKTPSFVISPERQIWHCFGACGDGGDVFKFLMKWENITFVEAVKELAQKTGVPLKNVAFEDKEWIKKEKIFTINSLALEYYQYILHKTKFGKKPLKYLLDRGLNTHIIDTFKIGYAPSSWDSLLNFLRKKEFKDEEIQDSGLLVKTDSNRSYDRFRGRIIFPILDIRGNIIGFSGRVLDADAHEAKYINTPETVAYHKRESLFGIYQAKDSIKKEGNVVLVEGEFDMIALFQSGISFAVAAKGTAVTKEQLLILKRLTPRITLCMDADEAGVEAMKRVTHDAEDLEFEVYVLDLENAKDPAEALVNNPLEFKKQLKSPELIYDYLIKKSSQKYDLTQAIGKKKIGEEVIPFIIQIQNPIVKTHYINKLASLLGISGESIEQLMKKQARKPIMSFAQPAEPQVQSPMKRQELIEKYVLSLLLQHEKPYEVADGIFTHLSPEDFTYPAYQKIVTEFLIFRAHHPENMDSNAFNESLPSQLRPAVNELYLFSPADLKLDKEVAVRMALELKKFSLKKKISLLMRGNTDDKAEKELSRFSTALKEVEKLITSLYNYNL